MKSQLQPSAFSLQPLLQSAAAYGRASTDKQEQSIAAQSDKLVAYANLQNFVLDDDAILLDDDTSGGIPFAERDKGALLLAGFQSGRFQHLIVPTIDRLGRNALDVQNTIERIHQLGGTVHILDLGGANFNTRSPVSGLIIAVLAWAAQMELVRIRERVNDGLARKRDHGELCGSLSFGWDAVRTGEIRTNKGGKEIHIKTTVDNPDEQKWILHMKFLRDAGQSWNAIARDLNSRSVPTKQAGQMLPLRDSSSSSSSSSMRVVSGRWQAAQVKKILSSKTVTAWLAQREQN
jgi:putative DNA-invertase from lambdoid prophage Rac